jgi:GNAT superfamily N-acetyltransferase
VVEIAGGALMDQLIRLYDLPPAPPTPAGIVLRTPIGPERDLLAAWVTGHFGAGWASEVRVALAQQPSTLLMALEEETIVGFSCHDATARGMFGPIGVAQSARGRGIGAALAWASFDAMRRAGYAYAVAGWVGPSEFFRKAFAASDISGSSPGLYRGMLRS